MCLGCLVSVSNFDKFQVYQWLSGKGSFELPMYGILCCDYKIFIVLFMIIFQEREELSSTMRKIVSVSTRDVQQTERLLNSRHKLRNHSCYKKAVGTFHDLCFNVNKVG